MHQYLALKKNLNAICISKVLGVNRLNSIEF